MGIEKTYYDEENHKYYVNDIEKPSVTEICDPISFKRLNALDFNILERARKRGAKCHELFEEYLLCEDLDIDLIESEYIPYIQQFVLWVKTYRPKVIFTEKKLFGEEFCGTADLICIIDNKVILIDFKTTSQADKKSLSVQLYGYKYLCEKYYNLKIDECWYLHLKKDTYVFKPIKLNQKWFELLLEHNKFMKQKYNEKGEN